MFQVYENNRTADTNGYPNLSNEYWSKSKFDTYGEAVEYADTWLGHWSPGIENLINLLESGNPYDYSGYGDKIYIKQV